MRYCRLAIDIGTLSITLLAGGVGRASAQDLALEGRAPRFMFVERPEAAPRPMEARNMRVLRDRISLDLDGATLADGTLGAKRLTATFKDEPPSQVLHLIAASLDVRIGQQGRVVTIKAVSGER